MENPIKLGCSIALFERAKARQLLEEWFIPYENIISLSPDSSI